MWRDELYLKDILEAIDHSNIFIAGGAARNRCPGLREQISAILASEFGAVADQAGR